MNRRISDLAEELGRASSEVTRSACALVVLDRDAGERPIEGDVVPLEGPASIVADGIRALARPYTLLDAPDGGERPKARGEIRLEGVSFAYGTDEAVEGRDAFLEKRPPDWTPFPYYY